MRQIYRIVEFLLNKKSILNRVSSRKRRKKNLDFFTGSSPVIEANFVEVSGNYEESCDRNPTRTSRSVTENGEESIEKLQEYLKTSSPEELARIFEELRKLLGNEKCSFGNEREKKQENGRKNRTDRTAGKKERIREISREAFETLSEAACREAKRVKEISKTASEKASRFAAENKDSAREVSEKIFRRLKNSSPEERKLILLLLLQAATLKKPTLKKNPAFSVLLQGLSNPFLNRKEAEELIAGFARLFKRRA